jgi:hypothetical protein
VRAERTEAIGCLTLPVQWIDTIGDDMDFQVIRTESNGKSRIYFDMDLDTAWEFARRIGDVIGASDEEMAAIREEIY